MTTEITTESDVRKQLSETYYALLGKSTGSKNANTLISECLNKAIGSEKDEASLFCLSNLPTLVLSRCVVRLFSGECDTALDDAHSILSTQRDSKVLFQGHICRAFAHTLLSLYVQAISDYESAYSLCVSSECLDCYKTIVVAVKELLILEVKKNQTLHFPTVDWVSCFGLSSLFIDNEEPNPNDLLSKIEQDFQSEQTTDLPLLVPCGENLHPARERHAEVVGERLVLPFPAMHSDERNRLAKFHKELGNKAYDRKAFAEALSHYSVAIQFNPSDHQLYTNRALVFRRLHRFPEAITDCTLAVQIHPTIKAYHHRACAQSDLGHHFMAIEDYKRALLFENNAECREGLLNSLEILRAEMSQQYPHLAQEENNQQEKANDEPVLPRSDRLRARMIAETIKFYSSPLLVC